MNNTLEIKYRDLRSLNKEEYLLVDIRKKQLFPRFYSLAQ